MKHFLLSPRTIAHALFAAALTVAGCSKDVDDLFGSGGNGGESATGSDPSTTAGPGATTSTDASSSTGMMGCPNDCDDGFACTIDNCNAGVCSHAVGPNSGETACPPGQFCELLSGCVQAMACASTDQCVASLGGDPCKTNIVCDPAQAICKYSILDNDGDFHAPLVCGGDDCNDADATVFPGAVEACDGADDNCNQQTDENATCGPLQSCQAGACTCAPENLCGAACPDKTSDPQHCGSCNHPCGAGSSCQNSQCVCAANLTPCNGGCVDILTDEQNCNGCGIVCAGSCQNGACTSCVGDLMLIVDNSGSMTTALPAGNTRFDAMRDGVAAYMAQAASNGTGVGMILSPISEPIPMCQIDADCGPGGLCFSNICIQGNNGNSCEVADYQMPVVAIAPLPGNASAVNNAIAAAPQDGGSTPPPALQGALAYAQQVTAQPSQHVSVVLFADSMPNACTGNADVPTDLLPIAQQFAAANPPVKTYVIALGSDFTPAQWNQVAAAGGTGTAYIAQSTADVTNALASIRAIVAACN